MANEVHRVDNNFRYRIFTIHGSHYIVDMDQPFGIILLPILYWLLPHTVYQMDDVTFQKMKYGESIQGDKTKTNLSILGVGGLAMILSNLLDYIADVFHIGTSIKVNISIILLAGLIMFTFRVYFSIVSKKNLKERVNLEDLPKEKIFFWPTSVKHILFTVFYFLFFLTLTIVAAVMFIVYKEPFGLLGFTIFLLFYFILGAANVTFENFKVKR